MKKLAVFVEGQTEQLFVVKLIKEIASTKSVSIVREKASGGSRKNERSFVAIEGESIANETQYFVLVVDCGNDSKVKSDIRDRYEGLLSQGYQKIIGIRDVYPDVSRSEVAKLRANLNVALPKGTPTILFILGIMEFESWILAEYKHFTKVHAEITVERIKQELKIDIIKDDLSQRPCPSRDLSDIYWLEKLDYNKNHTMVSTILSLLDYSHLERIVSSKFTDLRLLYSELSLFFR